MENKKEILAPNKRFAKSDEQDLELKLNLETSEKLLRIGDRDIILDMDELYEKERNESSKYKIYGKIKMIFRNLYSGTTEYSYLKQRLYLNGDGSDGNFNGFLPYDEFAFLRRDVYRQIVNPTSVTGSTLGQYNPSMTTIGSSGHTLITPITAPYHNWNLHLSYVYSGDTAFPMTYTLSGATSASFVSGNGIPFRLSSSIGNYYEFTSPIEHGINQGEYITLSGITITGNTFYVNEIGNEIYDSEKYVVKIIKSQIPTTVNITGSTIFVCKRCLDINDINGTTSQYYVHKHKTLTGINDYIMDYVGFESSIFEDEKKILFENSVGQNDVLVERNRMESVLYDFKNPFILSGLTNNLGYLPTEVYVSMIFRNGDGYFNYPPKVGYKFNFHDTWIDYYFDNTKNPFENSLSGTTFTGNTNSIGYTGFTFTKGTEIPIGTKLIGAFVEYNPKEMKERIISNSYHKITNPTSIFNHGQSGNTFGFTGATPTNLFGLIYQPHYKVKLRELSPYTETSTTQDIFNLPENANFDSGEKVWRWRDLYQHGYVDIDGNGTDYPFINGNHYVKNDINFYLRNEKYYLNKSDGISEFDYKAKNEKNIC
jgi:hypothetical protein